MNEKLKRKKIRKYFESSPLMPIALIVIGIVIVIVGNVTSFEVIEIGDTPFEVTTLGLSIFAIGGTVITRAKRGKPTDVQIDNWFNEDLSSMEGRALKKLGLDKSDLVSEAIIITGPILWGANGVPEEDLKFKKGKDKSVRFSINKITLFLLTEKQIAIYQCTFNFMKNVTLNDNTDEYFYKDITSVRTREKSSNIALPNGKKLVNSEILSLQVAGNDAIEIILNDPALEDYTDGTIPTSRTEKSVQTIRTLLREKKA